MGAKIKTMGARIKKIDDEDHYSLIIRGAYTRIDEEQIDGPKLMAMLGKEELVGTTVGDVLDQLDRAKVGFEMEVILKEHIQF